jgi:hypothetical protein
MDDNNREAAALERIAVALERIAEALKAPHQARGIGKGAPS